jgi:hypothetical protein
MDPWSSYSLYGGSPPPQPTNSGNVDHPAGTSPNTVRTLPLPGSSPAHNPTLVLVGMLGVAVVLVMRLHGHFD